MEFGMVRDWFFNFNMYIGIDLEFIWLGKNF